jgi:hypothetical protein
MCTLVKALRLCTGCTTHRGSRGIALLFLDHGTRRGEGSASRPGRSLPSGKTRYPLYRRLGGPQGRSGQVRKIRKKHILEIFLLKFGVYFPKLFGFEFSVEPAIFIMFFITVIYDVFL